MPFPIISSKAWPTLEWSEWRDTAETLHMFMQIVGKTRTALSPLQNHWWNVPFYISARGLYTSAMPIATGGLLDIEFDFIAHRLNFRVSSGDTDSIPLEPQTVAVFFDRYQLVMKRLGVDVSIDPLPVEIAAPVRFNEDHSHKTYDAAAAHRFWQVLSLVDPLFKRFSSNFYGKISPVHFFWGAMDLAVTRFNGGRAPARDGADDIQSEAYSHQCISAGFWPGNGGYGQAAFYAYAAPVPAGLGESVLQSAGAFNHELGEFILNYADVRRSADPAATVLAFLNDTYAVAAKAAGWDRSVLDRSDLHNKL